MPPPSLVELLEEAQSKDNPFETLYAIAKSLRDIGLSQLDLYRIFSDLYHKHQNDEDETFYDTIADVLDCIWCGGWGKSRELFDSPLTSECVRNVTIDVDEPRSADDDWQLTIDHPSIYLRFDIEHPRICREFLAFLRRNLNQRIAAELKLGTLENATVFIIKDDEYPNRFFIAVLSDHGTVRYTINVDEIGQYIGALMQAVNGLADTK